MPADADGGDGRFRLTGPGRIAPRPSSTWAILFALILPVLAVLAVAAPEPGTSNPADRAPTPVMRVAAAYPFPYSRDNPAGSAEIRFSVDANGAVLDCKVVEATHPEFGAAALAAARQWTFLPAIEQGKPVAGTTPVKFEFDGRIEGDLERAMGRRIFRELAEPAIPAESLWRMPSPFTTVWPKYPETFRQTGTKGFAMISFVIDRDGRTINPELVEASHAEFAIPALAAVCNLRYWPVRDESGAPQYVSMIVRFNLDESMLKEQAKALARERMMPPGTVAIGRRSIPRSWPETPDLRASSRMRREPLRGLR